MVKNTIGGKKGKMLSNKRSGSSGGDKKLRLSMDEDEIYVCVSKTFGGGIFEVMTNDNIVYNAHLRGKMKGPNKRHNFVSLFSILLVGKRADLSNSKDCDILFVYDDHDILSLSLLPSLNIHNLLSFHHNHGIFANHSNDLFSHNSNTEDSVIHTTETDNIIMDNNDDFDFNLI